VEVGSGSNALCGLENRRPKGYAGLSPVPPAIQAQQLTASSVVDDVDDDIAPSVPVATWRAFDGLFALGRFGRTAAAAC